MRKRKKNNYMLGTKSKNTNRIVAICGAHFMPIVMLPITKIEFNHGSIVPFFFRSEKKNNVESQKERGWMCLPAHEQIELMLCDPIEERVQIFFFDFHL